ncbi:hypothetical protein FRB99_002724 [Tulasnella sp. 403]|nr:hypothetical protein FRB99_002724 [Tulasnella sp. 403]
MMGMFQSPLSADKPPRSRSVLASFRTLFETPRPGGSPKDIQREVANLVTFLKCQREYGELLKRYNPLHDMSPDDHRVATANRVGLNMPREYGDAEDGERR